MAAELIHPVATVVDVLLGESVKDGRHPGMRSARRVVRRRRARSDAQSDEYARIEVAGEDEPGQSCGPPEGLARRDARHGRRGRPAGCGRWALGPGGRRTAGAATSCCLGTIIWISRTCAARDTGRAPSGRRRPHRARVPGAVLGVVVEGPLAGVVATGLEPRPRVGLHGAVDDHEKAAEGAVDALALGLESRGAIHVHAQAETGARGHVVEHPAASRRDGPAVVVAQQQLAQRLAQPGRPPQIAGPRLRPSSSSP